MTLFLKIFMLLCLLAAVGAVYNQFWSVIICIKSLTTDSYDKIVNGKFGEKYGIPVNEATFNLLGSFMYGWFSFIALIASYFIIPLSKSPFNIIIYCLYFFFALMSGNLLACSMIKRKIDDIEFNTRFKNDLPINKKFLIRKYILWSGVLFVIYSIMFFAVNLHWFIQEFKI